MNNKHVPPKYKEESFHCPHCDVLAYQSWHLGQGISYRFHDYPQNTDICTCIACNRTSIWVDGKMVYPLMSTGQPPHKDMPEAVKKIYEEARSVVSLSPRSAAALIRVLIEKLVKELRKTDKERLNKVIGRLKNEHFPGIFIECFNSVKTITNEGGAHAGRIDLRDEDGPEILDLLFHAANYIVEETIEHYNKLKTLNAHATKVEESKSRASEQT